MKINSRIYVAGHRGLVGSAIIRTLEQKGFENLITRTHAELELLDAVAVQKFFAETKPECFSGGSKSWRYTRKQHISC